jgi:gliding motility-associated lipoprotein GldJ
MAYCQWRTDRVNELALVSGKYIEQLPYAYLNHNFCFTEEDIDAFLLNNPKHPEYKAYNKQTIKVPLEVAVANGYKGEAQEDGMVTMYQLPYEWVRDQFVFNTEKYLHDAQYQPTMGPAKRLSAYGEPRKINTTDGILVTGYRLPTEAEWEYAAFAPIAQGEDGVPTEGKIYPWSGFHPRDLGKVQKGQMAANFIRGRGDLMGVAGAANDGYVFTAPVDAYAPNDFGLYNMAGNVNEWVLDVYRETTFEETNEYNPYRGNIYTKLQRNADGTPVKTAVGALAVEFKGEDDKRNFRDGDAGSTFATDYPLDTTGLTIEQMENVKFDPSDVLVPRINNNSRVYKGGSWNDRIYWLNPTTRRYMDQSESSKTVGFRCAMSMLGQQQ